MIEPPRTRPASLDNCAPRARGALLLLALVVAAQGSYAAEPEKWQLMQRAVLVEQDPEKIRLLVAGGVDPNAPIGCGTFAPLDGAVHRQNPELVGLLLSLGATPTERQMVEAAFSPHHDAALKMVTMLQSAGDSINAREYFSGPAGGYSTPLHQAVWRENEELVRYVLGQEGIQLDHFNTDGYTPLMIAVEKGADEILDMLLAAGADPAVRNARGMDAAGVADQVIKRQESFRGKLREHRTRP